MGLTVKNKHKSKPEPCDVYIGRGSILGNPFTHLRIEDTKAQYKCESREHSIESFEKYLMKKIEEKDLKICGELNRIFIMAQEGNVNLICFCKPKSCHGDVIKKIIEEKINIHSLRDIF